MWNVYISVYRDSKSGILCTLAQKLSRQPSHFFCICYFYHQAILITVLVFEEKKCVLFSQNEDFHLREMSKKCAFSIEECHYNVGLTRAVIRQHSSPGKAFVQS